ncbi:CRISPR-associated protein Csh2 [Anaerobacterium chartisolvens]|uniref:CRISPR-associated protein Csh2 n=1 Tax=Anaerobacterium chartisolvens TaxID=1297424 RepID=A0A369AWU9_9FIRM|nr:type I CRISPR-associated protein Cas7 [Anaerobacterium chartisolvens]RCX12706.1 CRISPR-associated protein Csh2 [Anaerobacterium chartisolvens]
MKNRVYGVAAIKSVMSNWNADFTGRPKSISRGDIFGSDKAFKYPIKRMWENDGEKVIYIKSYKIDDKAKGEEKDKLQPRDLAERYMYVFPGAMLEKGTSSKEVLKNLFSAIDVMSFGATFAEKDQNISITGAVQVGQGFNKYDGTIVESQDILSPFRNSSDKKEDASATSLGTKVVADEAHYFYPFSVNPFNYNEYIGIVDSFEGYTREAYQKFKRASLVAATAFNTNSKSGCENEFAIFVECREGADLYLPPLDRYVRFNKGTERDEIDITGLDFLKGFGDSIEKIEVYYNPLTVSVKTGLKDSQTDYNELNIFSGLEIS